MAKQLLILIVKVLNLAGNFFSLLQEKVKENSKKLYQKFLSENPEYEKASLMLSDILNSPDILPGIVMYHVFCDIERCCRQLGNRKNEENYREARLSMFEKLLS